MVRRIDMDLGYAYKLGDLYIIKYDPLLYSEKAFNSYYTVTHIHEINVDQDGRTIFLFSHVCFYLNVY